MRAPKVLGQKTPATKSSLFVVLGAAALLAGCNSSGGSIAITPGTGGAQNGNGGQSSGGSVSTGGMPTAGGASGTAGAPTTGGAKGTGGTTSTAGTPSSGGALAGTGGTVLPIGGVAASGGRTGAPGSGGKTGTPGTGGSTVPGTGGTTVPGAGGLPAAGGAPAQGGSTKTTVPLTGHYQMENLDRGVVAVKVTGGVYVGWRMMGYEYTGTDGDTSYNLYKDGTLLKNVTDSTNYLDAAGTATSKYTVSAVLKSVEGKQSAPVSVWAQQYLSIPVSPPPTGPLGGTYSPSDGSPCDLDGDGQLDLVLKWDPSNSQDSSFSNKSDNVYIDGIKMDGTRLWRIDVGMNIRAGAHDTQMSAYDFDGDGKCEVAFKTAPATKDGKGNFLAKGPAAGADNTKDYRGPRGMALGGPEWLTVFSGATGAELDTVEYPVLYAAHNWGDSNGNRSHRYNGGFAFVKDGGVATGLPSIIQQRGYYTVLTISALTYRNGVLAKNWVYDSVTSIPNGGGDHTCMAADVDGDGAQEVIPGARIVNSDGSFRCDSAMGHGDALDVTELIPGKGISVFSIHESLGGMDAHDADTCKNFYFKITESGVDSNRGRAEYVGTGDEAGASCTCASCNTKQVLCATGAAGGPSAGTNFVMYWDADEWRELENANSISKAGGGTLLTCSQCAGNNGSKNTPTLTADMLGDWREEIIWRESSNTALRMYTTTDVTKRRIYTLMHDPTYRAQVNFEQSSYNQPPHVGFQINPGMPAPPVPSIFVK
jgi:rhamnogalacturonan endolyase